MVYEKENLIDSSSKNIIIKWDVNPDQIVSITNLDLSSRRINDLSPIRFFSKLEELRLAQATCIKIGTIDLSKKLKILKIKMFKYDYLNLCKSKIVLDNIEELHIHCVGITDIFALSGLLKLKKLFIKTENKFTNVKSVTDLLNLKILEELNLDGNKIRNVEILQKTNVKSLSLKSNNIHKLHDIKGLITISSLNILDVRDNPLNQLEILEFQKQFPNIKVLYDY